MVSRLKVWIYYVICLGIANVIFYFIFNDFIIKDEFEHYIRSITAAGFILFWHWQLNRHSG